MFCSVKADEGNDAVLQLSGHLTYICMPLRQVPIRSMQHVLAANKKRLVQGAKMRSRTQAAWPKTWRARKFFYLLYLKHMNAVWQSLHVWATKDCCTLLLRPVAQLYGQVRADWNQCFVIDCSLSHPAGHKPFTCSHSVLRNTWLNIHAVRWMCFSAHLSVHLFTISQNLTWALFVSSAVSELSSAWFINRFLRYVCCWIVVKDKSLSVLMVDRCCRFASLKPVQNSRQ